jgi:hypothetical protein
MRGITIYKESLAFAPLILIFRIPFLSLPFVLPVSLTA